MRVVMLAVFLVLLAPLGAAAQIVTGTYDTQWALLREAGPEIATGSTVIDVVVVEEGPQWRVDFRDRATGRVECVWRADVDRDGNELGTYVQCGQLSGYDSDGVLFYGETDRPAQAFRIRVQGYDCCGGGYDEQWLVGRRRTTAARAVAIASPNPGQIVSGTVAVRVQVNGFAAGPRSWVLLVDGVQRQTGTVTTDSFTVWFNTTRVVNGAHMFVVRVSQAGQTAEAAVQVTSGN